MPMLPATFSWWTLACAALLAATPAAAVDKADCGLLLLHESGGAGPALGRKLAAGCVVKTVEVAAGADRDLSGLARELRRRVQDLRQQGAQRVLVGGAGVAAHLAMAYTGTVGDVDGVLVFGPEERSALGALPDLAGRLRQHAPVLWVVGSDDPLAKKGEDDAFAKAPPHPHSRFVTVKADRRGAADAGVRTALDWLRALD